MPTGAEVMWQASVKRYEAQRAEGRIEEWRQYHLRLRDTFWALGDEHNRALERLGNNERGRKEHNDELETGEKEKSV